MTEFRIDFRQGQPFSLRCRVEWKHTLYLCCIKFMAISGVCPPHHHHYTPSILVQCNGLDVKGKLKESIKPNFIDRLFIKKSIIVFRVPTYDCCTKSCRPRVPLLLLDFSHPHQNGRVDIPTWPSSLPIFKNQPVLTLHDWYHSPRSVALLQFFIFVIFSLS